MWFLVPRIDVIYNRLTNQNDGEAKPEYWLPIANFGSVSIPISLFWFAWTVEFHVHWFITILSTFFYGIGQVAIFNSVQNYYIKGLRNILPLLLLLAPYSEAWLEEQFQFSLRCCRRSCEWDGEWASLRLLVLLWRRVLYYSITTEHDWEKNSPLSFTSQTEVSTQSVSLLVIQSDSWPQGSESVCVLSGSTVPLPYNCLQAKDSQLSQIENDWVDKRNVFTSTGREYFKCVVSLIMNYGVS